MLMNEKELFSFLMIELEIPIKDGEKLCSHYLGNSLESIFKMLTLMLLVANFGNYKMMQKNF